jgi:Fic family protein
MAEFPLGTYRARSTQFVVRLQPLDDEILTSLEHVISARTIIERAELLPAHDGEMRRSAAVGTVHYSTQIEGNALPTSAAAAAVRGQLNPTTRDERELINYVNALHFLDEAASTRTLDYSPEFILRLHKIVTDGLGSTNTNEHTFRPEHEGAWRDGIVQIQNDLEQVEFVGPHPDDIPGLMASYSRALDRNRNRPAPILAGIAHWGLTYIHPFADGNGRMARLLTIASLMREGFLRRRLFSFERYYARDRDAYFVALRSPGDTEPLNTWLTYFMSGLAASYQEAAEKVSNLETVARQLPATIMLRPIESSVLLELVDRRQYDFTRSDFAELGKCSASTAKESLLRLADAGVIHRVGSGPATRYTFARHARGQRSGHHRRWTDERIRAELRDFARGRTDFPSVQEFKDAGLQQLYEAIARYGGAARWASELGLERVNRRGRSRGIRAA